MHEVAQYFYVSAKIQNGSLKGRAKQFENDCTQQLYLLAELLLL